MESTKSPMGKIKSMGKSIESQGCNGTVLVETYMIAGMGHGTPIAPGSGEDQCGRA